MKNVLSGQRATKSGRTIGIETSSPVLGALFRAAYRKSQGQELSKFEGRLVGILAAIAEGDG